MKKLIFECMSIFILFTISNAQAEETSPDYDKNNLFVETSGSIIYSNYNFSLNYERLIGKDFSLRAGLGLGRFLDKTTLGKSGIIMANLLIGNNHKLEIGLGVNYTFVKSEIINDKNTDVVTNISYNEFSPCISLGYRTSFKSGFLIRTGLTWVYNFGIPFQLSFGYEF